MLFFIAFILTFTFADPSTLLRISNGQRYIETLEPEFLSVLTPGEVNLEQEFFKDVSVNATINDKNNTTEFNSQSADVTDIFRLVKDSIVLISDKEQQASGSGFVYSQDGHIITNNHVVQGAELFDVVFPDRNTYTAKVIGKDPYNDIAVLQIIDDFSNQNVNPLSIGNSSEIEVGQQVIAIGNPLGYSNTMTTGIVSQIGSSAENSIDPELGGFIAPNVIQTDAAINPGNSGGPMLNLKGEVIGINTAIANPVGGTGFYIGIGFAVPSNAITRIVPALIQEGHYDHAWLGFSGVSLYPDIAESLGLPRNYKGVLVESVDVGGPADEAGLVGAGSAGAFQGGNVANAAGDIIIALDGQPIKGIEDVIVYIDERKSVGENIVVTVSRNGQVMDLNAILEPRPVSTG